MKMSNKIFVSKLFLAVVLLLLCIKTSQTRRHFYTQFISDLRALEHFELKIVKNLENQLLFTNKLPVETVLLISAYLEDFHQSTVFANREDWDNKKAIHASKSPICSYRLLRRVAILLVGLVKNKSFDSNPFVPLKKQIVSYFSNRGWPNENDLWIVVDKILRIQNVYNLTVEQLGNGWISTMQTNCTLNSLHYYEIADVAIKTMKFGYAIQWLMSAKERASLDMTISIPTIEEALQEAFKQHNKDVEEVSLAGMEPDYFDRPVNLNNIKDARKFRDIQYEAEKGKRQRIHAQPNYWALCSGENFQTEMEKSHLFCWYERKIHETFMIGPMKMEFLARNPDVIQIYDVLGDEEIETIVKESETDIEESQVMTSHLKHGEDKNRDSYDLGYRTSVHTWYEGSYVDLISSKVELLTGLKVVGNTASEDLQVASYSFGGHFLPHTDEAVVPSSPRHENRFATFMFYFNDIEQGGSTVFTSLGVATKPVKGSALFWYNLYRDGTTDWGSLHGACPVLLGEKWIANKWIKIGDQFVRKKCGLEQRKLRFRVPVNNEYLHIPKGCGFDEIEEDPELSEAYSE